MNPSHMHLSRLPEQTLERLGDHESLVFEGRSFRFHDQLDRSARIATLLTELGVTRGDRVLIVAQNRPEISWFYLAAWRIGAIITPLVVMSSVRDLVRVMESSEPAVVVTEAGALSNVQLAVGRTRQPPRVVTLDLDLQTEGVHNLSTVDDMPLCPVADGVRDDDIAALLFTGGTTGRSKGVLLTHRNLWSAGRSRMQIWADSHVNRSLMPLPMSHAFGLLMTVADWHWEEPRLRVLMRRFSAADALRLVDEQRVDELCLVPAAVESLVAESQEGVDISTLRFAVCGSAPLPDKTRQAFQRAFPDVELRMGYGLSESSALVTGTRLGEGVPGSVGRAVPDCELRIVDADDVVQLPGERGEIVCRSPFVMQGYWRDEEGATTSAVRDGWLHTGDIGYLDKAGNLFIVGRSKDVIIRGGFNIYPADIESALLEHPTIEAAVVVGEPHDKLGEEVVAFVTTSSDDLVAEDVVEYARDHIGGYKYPRRARVVDEFPRTPLGKIDRVALRQQLATG